MNPWIVITAISCAFFAALGVFGQEKHRRGARALSILSGLLCAALLAGPPFDSVAGGIILAGISFVVLMALISR